MLLLVPIGERVNLLLALERQLHWPKSSIKVLLVDMDFFSPKLSERFNLKTSKGISNYLAEEVSISDTITHTDIENLDVVSAGTSSGKKEHFYSNPLIGKYIEEVF